MSTYGWVDLFSVLFPFLFSFHPRLRFYKQWPAFFPAVFGMMGLFVPWDALFTHAGIWGFNPEHVCGFYEFGLPIEEWLFFICVPYACVFTYHCFGVLGVKDRIGKHARTISIALIIALLVMGASHWELAYTSTTFILLACMLSFVTFVMKATWMARFFFSYIVLLLPFLVVNGVLTGTGLGTPVVWYDNSENLGVRILTIPVEDIFYGMLMLLLTVTLYEAILSRRSPARIRGN